MSGSGERHGKNVMADVKVDFIACKSNNIVTLINIFLLLAGHDYDG